MTKKDLVELFEYNQWAKRKLLASLEPMTAGDFEKDLHSSHGGIKGTLYHMVNAEGIWTSRLLNEPVNQLDASMFKSPGDFEKVWNDLDRKLSAILNELTDEKLNAAMEYRDSKGNKYVQPRVWALSQLFNHFTYHRGQIVALQRQLGYKPANTDLIGFYREKSV